MGITLPQLAKRLLGFLWGQEKWFGWDIEAAECPHLGSDAVSLKGLSAEMSFPMGCEFVQVVGVRQDLLWWPSSPGFCRRCGLGEPWRSSEGQLLTVEKPMKMDVLSYRVQLSLAVFKECF